MRFSLVPTLAAIIASTCVLVPAARAEHDWQFDQAGAAQSSGEQLPARLPMANLPRFPSEEDQLDFRIQRVSQAVAALDHETEPAPPDEAAMLSPAELTPFSFQLMGYLSIALALFGLVVVVRNRPTFGNLRGKNDSSDARRTVVRCTIVLIVINLADLGFTSFLVPTRSFVELNPLADTLLDSLPALILWKSALIAGGTVLLLALWRHKIAQLASWGTAVTYVFAAMWWVMYFHAATS